MKGVQGWQVALLALALVTGVGMTFVVPSEENGEKKAKDPMEVEAGFSGSVPQKYTCDGQNISPPVSFSRLPDGTETVALIMDDPDAPTRVFDHWVAWNITSKSIPEGLPARKKLQNGIVQGTNDFDDTGYSGPCPPTGTHTYRIRAFALDTRLELRPGATGEELESAIEGHVIASDVARHEYPG